MNHKSNPMGIPRFRLHARRFHPEIRKEMNAVAAQRRRFGYRQISVILQHKGMIMKHEELYRLYTDEKLGVRR